MLYQTLTIMHSATHPICAIKYLCILKQTPTLSKRNKKLLLKRSNYFSLDAAQKCKTFNR